MIINALIYLKVIMLINEMNNWSVTELNTKLALISMKHYYLDNTRFIM